MFGTTYPRSSILLTDDAAAIPLSESGEMRMTSRRRSWFGARGAEASPSVRSRPTLSGAMKSGKGVHSSNTPSPIENLEFPVELTNVNHELSTEDGDDEEECYSSNSTNQGPAPLMTPISSESSPSNYTHRMRIVEALVQAMDNERLNDITLVGRDGVRVRATKYILACRSPGLQALLYQDPTQTHVFMGDYGENAIRALKSYCHSESIASSPLCNERNANAARNLAELACLAASYGFEALYGEADSLLCQLIEGSPWFATAAYDAVDSNVTPELDRYLFQFISGRCPDLLLETSSMKHFSKGRLQTFLRQETDCSDAIKLQFLVKWLEVCGSSPSNVEFCQRVAEEQVSLESLLCDPTATALVLSVGLFDQHQVNAILNGAHVVTGGRASLSGSKKNIVSEVGKNEEDYEDDDFEVMVIYDEEGETRQSTSDRPTDLRQDSEGPTSPNGGLTSLSVDDSPLSSGHRSVPDLVSPIEELKTKKKKKKKKKTKRESENKPTTEGLFYQLSATGDVLVYLIDSARLSPVEAGAAPRFEKPQRRRSL